MKNQQENKKVKIKYLDKRVAFITLALALGIGSCSLMKNNESEETFDIPSNTISMDATDPFESSSAESIETSLEENLGNLETEEVYEEESTQNNKEEIESSTEESIQNNEKETENRIEESIQSNEKETESSIEESSPSNAKEIENSNQETEESPKTEENKNQPAKEEKHEHHFENWKSMDDEQEQGLCSCGEVQTKLHHYIIKNITNTPNQNATYNEIIEYQCTNCGHIWKKSTIKNCVFGEWKYNPETKREERTCQVSGYLETRKHNHQFGKITKIDDTYEYRSCDVCKEEQKTKHQLKKTVNKDGTTTYECENPECNYHKTEQPTHYHNYDQFLRYESDKEYWGCECGQETTKNHTLGKETIDKVTHEVVQKCTTPGCNYEKRTPHTNHHNQFLRYEGEIEYWECLDCGKEITKQHTLDQGTLDKKTHEVVQKCTTPECNYEKRREHTPHQPSVFLNYVGSVENWECECGMTLTKDHSLGTPYIEEGTLDKVTKCTTVGCNYEERVLHNTKDNPHVYELDRANTDEEKETWKCACGDSYTQGHRYNDGVAQPDGTYLQTCETCGQTRNHHTCIKGDPEIVYLGTPTECYKIVYNCKICGEYVTEDAPVGHRLYTSGGKRKCRNGACTYTEELTSGANEFYEEPSIETTSLPEKMKIKMIGHIHNN